mmetsp:Transcript_28047/g.42974  ORF Transcript_28047/g.42974 Transcript_28047/m.42974 type:complete len:141 (+) Transcript_28047:82-504(+)
MHSNDPAIHSRGHKNKSNQQQQQQIRPALPALHSRDRMNELQSPSPRQHSLSIRNHAYDPRYRRRDSLSEALPGYQTANTGETRPRRIKSETNTIKGGRPQVPRQASEPPRRLGRSALSSHQPGSQRRNLNRTKILEETR